MNYSNEFREMLAKAEEGNLYAGSGNPNANILIIGKELAFDKDENQEQAKNEIDDNIRNWKENIASNLSQKDSLDWTNPLYLYKHSVQKEGHTWNKYQKLMDYIREVPHTKETNFQEFAFLTEYNQNPSKNSTLQENKDKQKASIKERDEFFKTTAFFQHFPIVIVAAGDYGGHKFGIKLEKTFGVTWEGSWEVRDSGLVLIMNKKGKQKDMEKPRQWISLHYSPTKLVIHTTQLSGSIKDKLLQEIARKVKDFAREKDIHF